MLDTSYLPTWLFTRQDIHLFVDSITKFEILVTFPSLLFTLTSFTCAAHMSTNSTYTHEWVPWAYVHRSFLLKMTINN